MFIHNQLDISQYNKLIGAYHLGGNHWTLLVTMFYIIATEVSNANSVFKVVQVKEQEILFVDPLGERTRMINQILKNWKYEYYSV